jgi:putative FmdB family regulatory protein
MPIYDFVCPACGREREVLRSLDAASPELCDVCGSPMRKRLSLPAIVFRGSGWAKKDRADNKAASASRPKDGAPKEGAKEPAAASGEAKGDGAGKAERDSATPTSTGSGSATGDR